VDEMTKKQKNTLISYILYYGGFIMVFFAMLFIIIYTILFNNYVCDVFHLIMFILLIVGIILPQFAGKFNLYYYFAMSHPNYKLKKSLRLNPNLGFIQGVPVNSFYEFNTNFLTEEKKLVLIEKNGLYCGVYNSKKIILDMRGWICKDKYVFELLQTFYRLQFIKKKKMSKKYIYKTIKDKDVKEFTLYIQHRKKEKKYVLSENNKIDSPLNLRLKNNKKSKFIDDFKFSIKDFYNVNE
jgi:hypothetical protein